MAKEKRSLQEIQKEYNQVCFEMGTLIGQEISIQMDLNKHQDRMRQFKDKMQKLILEGTSVQAEEKQIPSTEEVKEGESHGESTNTDTSAGTVQPIAANA